MKKTYAHGPNPDGDWHLLDNHHEEVAHLASEFGSPMGMGDMAEAEGFWHDEGKNSNWQKYLKDSIEGLVKRGSGPRHSIVGALCWKEACPVIAWSISCHHGGITDIADFRDGMKVGSEDPELMRLKEEAVVGERPPIKKFSGDKIPETLKKRETFAFAFRMLHSCIVDADRLDTEAHYQPEHPSLRQGSSSSLEELSRRIQGHIEEKSRTAKKTKINLLRQEMFSQAMEKTKEKTGFFSLTIPTGGGKTLTGMAFSLAHAVKHGLKRVIVAVPYTSIIEQNSDIYRKVLGEESVTEHHSSKITPSNPNRTEQWQQLASENWDSPVVVTTNVQFFESLFTSQNRRLRKLHNIANSVIFLDEVQTLPPELLKPTLRRLKELVKYYGCTIIFSTATQPAYGSNVLREHSISDIREIVENPNRYFREMERVRYYFSRRPLSWRDLSEKIQRYSQSLTILNTISDAEELCLQMRGLQNLYFLSGRLCGAHKREVLAQVKQRLDAGLPCHLVSTQVVEAGVDLDFPVVFRALGPLDSMAQAAGRCNREGRLKSGGEVFLFVPEKEKVPSRTYGAAKNQAERLIIEGENPQLSQTEVFKTYFSRFFNVVDADEHSICNSEDSQMIRTSSQNYRLIPEEKISVLVRRPEDRDKIEKILSHQSEWGLLRRQLRALQPYVVSLWGKTFEECLGNGLVSGVDGFEGLFEWTGAYNPLIGIII